MKRAITYGIILALLFIVACAQVPQQPAAPAGPTEGYAVHIAATKHAGTQPELFVHHYCKGLPSGVLQCQLYDSDKPEARLIGAEIIVPTPVWAKFDAEEKKNWHGHTEELTRVELQTFGMTDAEVEALKETLGKTHGKVIIFWDPKREYPDTAPTVSII
ncbi:DUF1264 domain-containing protein [Candidatus Woesearchaeota archaeon]|nr:DUF1264 domain-containing protein [Candidatus Woesearchaeota archaeon]